MKSRQPWNSRQLALVLWCCLWGLAGFAEAAEKGAAQLAVHDVLSLPNRPVRIEARVSAPPGRAVAIPTGVTLRLSLDGKPVSTAQADEQGRASFEYLTKMRGMYRLTVAVDESAPVAAAPAEATLCVWELRRPILLVELAALRRPATESSGAAASPPQPVSEAAEELTRLTQYYYNVIYVDGAAESAGSSAPSGDTRRWLTAHQFPTGYVADPTAGGLTAVIERLKQEGWGAMKSGVGRTKVFAEALLQQRLEPVLVPEPPKGELPRKAKAAKDWKDVRKKL